MKHILTIILLSITLFSFKGDKNVKYLDFEYHKTKQKRAFFTQKFSEMETGNWHSQIRIQRNGILKEDGYYLSDKLEVRNGPFVEYYFNGHLKSVGTYTDNQKSGEWKSYFPSGAVKSSGEYNEGNKEGVWSYFFVSGQVQKTGEYRNNKLFGDWVNYYNKGGIKWGRVYNEEGKQEGESEFYFRNGQLDKKGIFSNGKKSGDWEYYFETGERSGLVNFQDGDVVSEQYWNIDGSEEIDFEKANEGFRYPGGDAELNKFIGHTLKYPAIARNYNIQGTVFVSFNLDAEGIIIDAHINKGVHPSIDDEALRVINAMPNWEAGLIRNRPVSISYTLPVLFKLQ